MKRLAITIFVILCVVALSIGGYQLYRQLHAYHEGEEAYSGLEDYVRPPEPDPSEAPTSDESGDAEIYSTIAWPEVDFAALAAINPELIGWLYCEDTVINYPVVQGRDNSYYLKHLFDRTYNANGCLFLDCRVSGELTDPHSIIYGHHMKNGSMFSSLDGYKKQEYYDAHPHLLLLMPDANYVIELFAGYVANVNEEAWRVDFSDEIALEEWLAAAVEKSTFESGVRPLPSDRIITLSTCSYEFSNARYVVLGVLREDRGAASSYTE